MTIGEKIKRARMQKGVKQKELAYLLEVTPATVAQWETGRRNPKRESLSKIADALGMSLVELETMGEDVPDGSVIWPNLHEGPVIIDRPAVGFLDSMTDFLRKEKSKRENAIYENAKDNYDAVLKGTTDQLNDEGRMKVLNYAVDIADNPRYRKEGE